MNKAVEETRSRELRFKKHIEPGPLMALRDAILAIEGVNSLRIDEISLRVEYRFPETCYMEAWLKIQASPLVAGLSGLTLMREWFAATADENEQYRLGCREDCFTYRRNIYFQHHERIRQQALDSRKQPWRRYQARR